MRDGRNGKNCAGSSLIEVVVSIALLGLVIVPLCAALVTAHRLNARSASLLREQLAASNAIEILQSRGVDASACYDGVFEGVDSVESEPVEGVSGGCTVTVRSGETSFTCFIRTAPTGEGTS